MPAVLWQGKEHDKGFFYVEAQVTVPASGNRCLMWWCLMELQAGLARSVATQERSPGALARRNPEEASFYRLPVRRLHRGIGETRAW